MGREEVGDVVGEVFVSFLSKHVKFNRMVVVRIVSAPTHMMAFKHFTTTCEKVHNEMNAELVRLGMVKANRCIIHAIDARSLIFRSSVRWKWRRLLPNTVSFGTHPAVGLERD